MAPDPRIHGTAARGFGAAGTAAAYDRGRPEYPAEALAWIAGRLGVGPGRRVLDAGAGTGKLSRGLAAAGAEVLALEPVAAMRERLAGIPGVRALDGTAEAIPLPDGSVDAVACGQAFHWFREAEALAEFRRVLVPGGRLALLWNTRDESIPWVAALGAILETRRRGLPDTYDFRTGRWKAAFGGGGPFGPLERRRFPFVHRLPPAAVLDRVASVSFVAALPAADRSALVAEVRALLEGHPGTRGRAELDLPYFTDAFVAAATGSPMPDPRTRG
jgi:SAM-dependent methyltransferase